MGLTVLVGIHVPLWEAAAATSPGIMGLPASTEDNAASFCDCLLLVAPVEEALLDFHLPLTDVPAALVSIPLATTPDQ